MSPIMENRVEKTMEDHIHTTIFFLRFRVSRYNPTNGESNGKEHGQ